MRWLSVGRAVAAVAIVAGVVLAPVAAVAADPLVPVPVQPLPGLPSTTVKGLTNAGSIGNANATWYAWMMAQIKAGAGKPGPGGAVVKPSIPITGPKPVPGVALGATNAAVSGWFAIAGAGAGVKFVGEMTGNDFDSAMCGADSWLQTAYGWLTMGMGPACSAQVLEPNLDVVPASVSANGWTLTLVGTYGGSYCYAASNYGTIPTGNWRMGNRIKATGGYSNVAAGPGSKPGTLCGGTAMYSFGNTSTQDANVRFWNISTGETHTMPDQTSADPLRQSRCTLTWPDGSTTEGFVGQYRESEGFPIGAIDAGCTEAYASKPGAGPDLWPTDIKVGSTNTETGAQTEIIGDTTPDWTTDEKKGLDPGDGSGLKLWKIVDTKKFSCMTWAIDCSNWWTQTSSGTQPQTDTGTYRCTWGGNKVALNECGPYRTTFNDPDLDSRTITDPGGTPQPYPIPGPQPNPVPNPNPVPGPGPAPGPGTDPAGECFADGWSAVANPLDWVLVPVKCALVWAFVPSSTAVTNAVTSIGTAAGNVAAVDPLLALVAELPTSSGCDGIPISLTFFGQEWHGRLLEACTGEARAAATVVNGLMTLAIITGAVLAVVRYTAAVFGFVGPGGSIEQTQRSTERVVQQSRGGGD